MGTGIADSLTTKTTKKRKRKPIKKTIIKYDDSGRPTKYSPVYVEALENVFKTGATIEQACSVAMIDKVTYYAWLKKYPDFSTRMEQARNWLNLQAKTVIADRIVKKKDDYNARWWLEKTEFKNVTQTNVQNNIVVAVPEDLNNKYGIPRVPEENNTEH